MDSWTQTNRELWDRWTEVHAKSSFYDVEAFRAGESTLKNYELDAMGAIDGLSLLHLQCHFGLDTLSWARLGARVLGVDFSPKAIELARSLAKELNQPARFLRADVLELEPLLDGEQFDRVFTSYGVLWWLRDLSAWARTIAAALRPGGRFVMVEFHPLVDALSDDGREWKYPYFATGEPIEIVGDLGYVEAGDGPGCPKGEEPNDEEPSIEYGWPHSLGEVVGSLLGAGLTIERFEEHPASPYALPGLREVAPGRYAFPDLEGRVPMLYTLVARRSEA